MENLEITKNWTDIIIASIDVDFVTIPKKAAVDVINDYLESKDMFSRVNLDRHGDIITIRKCTEEVLTFCYGENIMQIKIHKITYSYKLEEKKEE